MVDRERQEEEYHFSDLEDTDVYGAPSPEVPDMPPPVRRRSGASLLRKSIFVFIVLMIGFFVYRYATKTVVPKVEQPKVSALPVQPSVPEKAVAPSPSLAQPTVRQQDIDNLNTKVTQIEKNIRDVSTDMESNRNRLGQIESTVSTLNNRLQEMNTSLQNLAEQLKPKKPPIDVTKKIEMKAVKHKKVGGRRLHMSYQVKAVIPGRAWLVTNDGSTLTVSVGSRVSGCGNVRTIDYQRERVITSAGCIFK